MAHRHDHGPLAHEGECRHHHGVSTGHGGAFALAVALNTIFVAVEFAFGLVANSAALIADAGHNLSDVLGLLLAWGAATLSRRAPDGRFTYGLRASSILAAVANAALLLVACGAIAWEAVSRLSQPPAVAGMTVTLVACVGIVINGLSAWLFAKGSKGDLNVRGAYLHMLADAAVSLGVVVAGLAMVSTGWFWLDPVTSLAIVSIIVWGTWGLLRESLELALDAVPSGIDLDGIEAYLRSLPGVADIHDLHIWGMSTTESALTVHLVIPEGYPGDEYMDGIERALHETHQIHHCTLQVELGTTEHFCGLKRA